MNGAEEVWVVLDREEVNKRGMNTLYCLGTHNKMTDFSQIFSLFIGNIQLLKLLISLN